MNDDNIVNIIGWIFKVALVIAAIIAVIVSFFLIIALGAALPFVLLAAGIAFLILGLLGASVASGAFEIIGLIAAVIGVIMFIFD